MTQTRLIVRRQLWTGVHNWKFTWRSKTKMFGKNMPKYGYGTFSGKYGTKYGNYRKYGTNEQLG